MKQVGQANKAMKGLTGQAWSPNQQAAREQRRAWLTANPEIAAQRTGQMAQRVQGELGLNAPQQQTGAYNPQPGQAGDAASQMMGQLGWRGAPWSPGNSWGGVTPNSQAAELAKSIAPAPQASGFRGLVQQNVKPLSIKDRLTPVSKR
jgi:hypothetical protein